MSAATIPAGTELLSYAEAGERLGVEIPAIKRRAQRNGWARVAGNDGRARVAVPLEVLAEGAGEIRRPASVLAAPPPGLAELAAELVRLAEDLRQARSSAEAARLEAAALRGELERLRSVAVEAVAYHRPLPAGYAVERSRLDRLHRWRRLADGAAGPMVADRWSAWRGAWRAHRRGQAAAGVPAVP